MYQFQVINKCYQDATYIEAEKGVDFLIEENDWNDYGYKTLYYIHATPKLTGGTTNKYLGGIRIMKFDQSTDDIYLLRKEFKTNGLIFRFLPQNYVSLSLDNDFYENIKSLLRTPNERLAFVSSLHMVLGPDTPLYGHVQNMECFNLSLLRDSSINDFVIQQGRKIMLSEEITFDLRTQSFTIKFPDSDEIKFDFCAIKGLSDSETIPNGIIAMIGKNGSGKSTSLYEIAKILYSSPDTRRLISERVGKLGNNAIGIAKLIMFSYSAFDNFILPGSTKEECSMLIDGLNDNTGRFVFCGLRDVFMDMKDFLESNYDVSKEEFLNKSSYQRFDNINLKNPKKLGEEYVKVIKFITNSDKVDLWNSFLKSIREQQQELWSAVKDVSAPIYLYEQNLIEEYEIRFNSLSTGYKFIMHAMSHLIAYCDNNNLILFDEPENHLQPPLLSFMISQMRIILAKYRSVMLISTHSPIILQEVFSSNVIIVNRKGAKRVFSRPTIQTYGESFGAITSDVFNINSDNTSYFQSIEGLYEEWNMSEARSLKDMVSSFEERLGMELSSQMESFIIGKYYKEHCN